MHLKVLESQSYTLTSLLVYTLLQVQCSILSSEYLCSVKIKAILCHGKVNCLVFYARAQLKL